MICPACLTDAAIPTQWDNLSLCKLCAHCFQTDLTPTIDYGDRYAEDTYLRYPSDTAFLRLGYILGRGVFSTLYGNEDAIDVGYGSGAFLRLLEKKGLSVYGNDVHTRDDGIRRIDLGADLRPKLLTMFDSLEHFARFDDLLAVQPGHIVVSIPVRPDSFLSNPSAWRHYKPGEHIHYFSEHSLGALMQRWGMGFRDRCSLEDVVRTPQPGQAVNILTYHFSRTAAAR